MDTPKPESVAIAPSPNGHRKRLRKKEISAVEPAASPPLILIVNFEGLLIGDLEDLEEATRTREIIGWMMKHTDLEGPEVMRRRPLTELYEIAAQVGAQIREVLKVPKAKARS